MNNLTDEETLISVIPGVGSLAGSYTATNLGIISLVVAILLFLVVSFTRRKFKTKGDALLLTGLLDSGKTAIFSNLAYGQTLPSHTSLQTNLAKVVLSPTKTIRVIDIPGHPRIRDQFQEHLKETKAIAFVVDCSTISRSGSAVAEHLHHVLHAITSLPPTQSRPTLLVLAHKTDLLKVGASSGAASEVAISRVRVILERELEKRRASQSGSVGVESLGSEEGTDMGGLECSGAAGGAFKFSGWDGGDVEFVSTWVKVGEAKAEKDTDGLEGLKDWLLSM